MWWGETWGFEFVDMRADVAGFVRFVTHPKRKTFWFWAAVIHGHHPVILCRDLAVPVPTQSSVLEIRSSALWSHAICETPFAHWTVAMEAYAVALDDPTDAYSGELGDRVGLAFDLEWEDDVAPSTVPGDASGDVTGYLSTGRVTGDLQLSETTLPITATGHRDHQWGRLDQEWFVDRMSQVTEGDRWVGWMLDEGTPPIPLARSLRDGVWI